VKALGRDGVRSWTARAAEAHLSQGSRISILRAVALVGH